MKAVRLKSVGQPLVLEEMPQPKLGSGEVLVEVKAAGICHSDAHYRKGTTPAGSLPLTLGHEVAGVVAETGPGVKNLSVGERVCLHYLVVCGECMHCRTGHEQFCSQGAMLGKHRNGGYAEYIIVPEWNAVALPERISFDEGAVMMCSSATALHALRKARLKAGETVAVYGAGGLGLSAVQLAGALGAGQVYAIDQVTEKLELAAGFGAVPIDAGEQDSVEAIRGATSGRGVDVAVELIGSPSTMRQAVQSLAPLGRAALAGLTDQLLELDSYRELIGGEAEVIGVSDHLRSELPELIGLVERGRLDLGNVITGTVPLEAEAINEVLDGLEAGTVTGRVVIRP
ncbi:alcohol dehydrogenase catalytic domain-containing protein [Candidatus Neomarinimicrobiota bacterium]